MTTKKAVLIAIVAAIVGGVVMVASTELMPTIKQAWNQLGSDKENITLAESQVKKFKGAVEMYYGYYRKWPNELNDLIDTPDGTRMIDVIPPDPWGSPYQLKLSGESVHAGEVKVFSLGPDKKRFTDDDIVITVSR
jgi:hypothetical protein